MVPREVNGRWKTYPDKRGGKCLTSERQIYREGEKRKGEEEGCLRKAGRVCVSKKGRKCLRRGGRVSKKGWKDF